MVSTKVGFEISPHEINRHMLVQCHGIYCPPHQSSALCSLWMSLAWWSRSWWSGSAGYTPRHVSDTDGSAARSVDDARTSVPAVLTFAVKRGHQFGSPCWGSCTTYDVRQVVVCRGVPELPSYLEILRTLTALLNCDAGATNCRCAVFPQFHAAICDPAAMRSSSRPRVRPYMQVVQDAHNIFHSGHEGPCTYGTWSHEVSLHSRLLAS